jgi:uncharacterized membrane protein YfcA
MLESAQSITIATIILGLVTGLLSGTLGIGGGVIVVPALVYLFHMPQKGAQGISLALMVPVAMMGVFQYWRLGNLQISAARLAWLCAGAAGGVLIGSLLADRLPAAVLRRAFAILLLVVAARMLWPARTPEPKPDALTNQKQPPDAKG